MSKKLILTSVTLLFIGLRVFGQSGNNAKPLFIDSFSQKLKYEVRAKYKRLVKKEKLQEAKLISDVIPGYPANWINSYVSVEVLATCNGKAMKALGLNEVLSTEQRNILNTIDMGTDIVINVKYIHKDVVTNTIENNTMHVSMTVIPDTEAEYIGGSQQMLAYLKKNAIDKISGTLPKEFQQAIVIFTVNEEGRVTAKIAKTSGELKTDTLLLDAINKMPKWKPAENSKGEKFKQEFEFIINTPFSGGC